MVKRMHWPYDGWNSVKVRILFRGITTYEKIKKSEYTHRIIDAVYSANHNYMQIAMSLPGFFCIW